MGETKALARMPPRRAPAPVRHGGPPRIVSLGSLAGRLQPALVVGPTHDPLEREAEATAARVMAMPAPGLAQPAATPPASVQRSTEDQPDIDSLAAEPPIPAEQQDPVVPPDEDVAPESLDVGAFAEIEHAGPEQPVAAARTPAVIGPEGGPAPRDVADRVANPGRGRPLDPALRGFMEPRFERDFSAVRVHDAPPDRAAAARIGARAFTHGRHIWMGPGESAENRPLMAHELTHVVQQTAPGPPARVAAAPTPIRRAGWAAGRIEGYARQIPGYALICVILGKSPITGEGVPRTAHTLLRAVLELVPGGAAILDRIEETRVLERAFGHVRDRLATLDLTWSRVERLVAAVIDAMPSWSPVAEMRRIFGPVLRDLGAFAADMGRTLLAFVLEGALRLAGPYGARVWGVLQEARDTLGLIASDPLGFARNLALSVVGGFQRFGANILSHLKKGLLGWLFGALAGAGITLPERFDFKGILSLVLQIVGITYANFRALLVKRLGPGGERKVAFIEKSVSIVAVLVREGLVGIWQRLLSLIEGWRQTVINGIRDFVITRIVRAGIETLAAMSNPVGAIIKIAMTIYDLIKTFLERMEQIGAVAREIFGSIGTIARGQIGAAVGFVERTLAAAVPVVIAFIAALLRLGGISDTIRGLIRKLQRPVLAAMDRLIVFALKLVKRLFAALLGKVNRGRKGPTVPFRLGRRGHELNAKKQGNRMRLVVRSVETDAPEAARKTRKATAGDTAQPVSLFNRAFDTDILPAAVRFDGVRLNAKTVSNKATTEAAEKALIAAGRALEMQFDKMQEQYTEDTDDAALLRAREPRIDTLEGKVDTYAALGAETAKTVGSHLGAKAGPFKDMKASNFYENDHQPEKGLAKLAHAASGGTSAGDYRLGTVNDIKIDAKGGALFAITVYRPVHRDKTATSARGGADGGNRADLVKRLQKLQTPRPASAEFLAEARAVLAESLRHERQTTMTSYAADPGASDAARAAISAGLKTIDEKAVALFGLDAQPDPAAIAAPEVREAGLAMTGEDARGVPPFAILEGTMVPYGSAPSGFGNYMEFDHVIEGEYAEEARAMRADLGDGEAIVATAERADTDGTGAARHNARQLKLARRPLFPGAAMRSYTYRRAGTIGLYRPVHREITAEMQRKKATLAAPSLAPLTPLAAAYLNAEPTEAKAALGVLHDAATAIWRHHFERVIDSHIDLIRGQYQTQMQVVEAANPGRPKARQQMLGIVSRIGSSLRALRASSLELLKR